MDRLLEETQSKIWEFPAIVERDTSIVKSGEHVIYEDSHALASLENAENFMFTTKDDQSWLLPSDSYLNLTLQLRKNDGTAYAWESVAAVGNQPAVTADDINLSDNGFNLFKEARYYIDDNEIERIDYVGISTLIKNIFEQSTFGKSEVVKHSQLWFLTDDQSRREYVRNESKGDVNLLLPINRIFPFCNEVDHVFRGARHRITLTLNNNESLIQKANGVTNGKVVITKCEWVVPYFEPSLKVTSDLEQQLARDSKINLSWNAVNMYREQPAKNKEILIPIASSIHNPTQIVVGLQKLIRSTSQAYSSMLFDNMDVENMYLEINGKKFPDQPLKNNFTTRDTQRLYRKFLEACKDNVSKVDFETFRTKYPLFVFNVSHHEENLFQDKQFAKINLYINFKTIPANDYLVYVQVENTRKAELNITEKRMKVIT